MNALFETVRELSLLTTPGEVQETFLLMSMGVLGTSKAFLVSRNDQNGQQASSYRGFSREDVNRCREKLNEVSEKLKAGSGILPHQVRIVQLNEPHHDAEFPRDVRILAEWFLDEQRYGLLGYGTKIDGESHDRATEDFLLRMVSAFMDALEISSVSETIRGLNEELLRKNQELQQALLSSQTIQSDLDRRYFHFKSICETTRELSENLNKNKLSASFLLSVMGTFSAQQGFVVLWNRGENAIDFVVRGYLPEDAPILDDQCLDAIFRSLIHPPFVPSKGEKHVQLLSKEELHSLELPGSLQHVAAFLVNQELYGLLGFGRSLAQDGGDQVDQELLSTLMQSFLVSLGNALSFETIEKLNTDLMAKNAELLQTLEQLQQSRQTITLLESARNRLSSLLRTETLRIKRVTVLDCVGLSVISLILAMVFNASSPGGIALQPETWSLTKPELIDVSWAGLKHESGGALFLDARPVEFYNQRRIAGAENLPLNLFDFVYSMRFAMLDPGRDIVVYGRNISRRYDELVAAKLTERGMVNVRVLDGGLRQWELIGLPVEP